MRTNRPVTTLICALLLWVLLPADARGADAFIIISDVDDTVKVTNVGRKRGIKAAVTSRLAFAGMAELYRQLLGPGSARERLTFISGSPRVLETKVDAMLAEAGFPAYTLVLRRHNEWLDPVFEYKTSRLNAMYGSSDARFLMIGDDTEADAAVYLRFSKEPEDPIYIRRVTGKALPDGCERRCTLFVTAYDIALHEFRRGRLNESQAGTVGIDVLTANDRSLLPHFQRCPTQFEQTADLPPALSTIKAYLDRRIARLCAGPREKDDDDD